MQMPKTCLSLQRHSVHVRLRFCVCFAVIHYSSIYSASNIRRLFVYGVEISPKTNSCFESMMFYIHRQTMFFLSLQHKQRPKFIVCPFLLCTLCIMLCNRITYTINIGIVLTRRGVVVGVAGLFLVSLRSMYVVRWCICAWSP